MLTPVEIQNKVFKAGGLGYDKKDVDSFLREVAENYEELYTDKLDLEEKLSELTKELSHYKLIEKTMQKALVLAEKTAEDTKNNAIQNAKQIEDEAVLRSQQILNDARNELENLNRQIISMYQAFETYKVNVRNLSNAQIELVNSEAFNIPVNLGNLSDLNDYQNVVSEPQENSETTEAHEDGFEFIESEN